MGTRGSLHPCASHAQLNSLGQPVMRSPNRLGTPLGQGQPTPLQERSVYSWHVSTGPTSVMTVGLLGSAVHWPLSTVPQ